MLRKGTIPLNLNTEAAPQVEYPLRSVKQTLDSFEESFHFAQAMGVKRFTPEYIEKWIERLNRAHQGRTA